MRFYLIVIITFFLLGCDQESKLNAHSYYINNGIGDRKIVSENQLLYPITIYPDVVEFVNDESFTLVKQVPSKDNSIVILGEHLYSMFKSYKNATELRTEDSKILINAHKWVYNIFYYHNASDSNSSYDIKIKNVIADSLINNHPYYNKIFSAAENYWIILNKIDKLIGPLTKEEYMNKRNELKVPRTLYLTAERE